MWFYLPPIVPITLVIVPLLEILYRTVTVRMFPLLMVRPALLVVPAPLVQTTVMSVLVPVRVRVMVWLTLWELLAMTVAPFAKRTPLNSSEKPKCPS